MEIKTLPPVKVLYHSTKTTLKDAGEYVFNIAKQLYTESAKQDLLPTGPLYWIYYGVDGKADTVFTLEIALPVNHAPITKSVFKWKQLPEFKCVEATHYGKWNELPSTYQQLVPKIFSDGHKLSACSREVYVNIDLNQPANNITQIQMGVE